jgi:uncharacterized protein with ATP-grasp and redox domains
MEEEYHRIRRSLIRIGSYLMLLELENTSVIYQADNATGFVLDQILLHYTDPIELGSLDLIIKIYGLESS